MKRIITFLCLVVIGFTTIQAQSDKYDYDGAKALIAYRMNEVSLRESDPTVITRLDSLKDTGNMTLSAIASLIPSNYKNKAICDSIKKLSEKEIDNIKNGITKFEKKKFVTEFLNGKGDDIKRKLLEDIKKDLESCQPDAVLDNVNDSKGKNGSTDPTIDRISTKSTGSTSLWIAYTLCLILVASNAYFFLQIGKYKNRLSKSKEKREKLEIELNQKLVRVNNSLDTANEKIRLLNTEIEDLNRDVANLENARAQQIRRPQSQYPDRLLIVEPEVSQECVYYLQASLEDGSFGEGSKEYRKGRSLFKVSTLDDQIGRFEFINEPETRMVALNSVTTYLRPVCEIEEKVSARDAQTIITTKQGVLKKTENGWKVSEKALIVFS